jgi:hypothetical protein
MSEKLNASINRMALENSSFCTKLKVSKIDRKIYNLFCRNNW